MPTPRKYCWVYQHRTTGEIVLVLRPHRRASPPVFYVKSGRGTAPFAWADFRATFKFVRRLKESDKVAA